MPGASAAPECRRTKIVATVGPACSAPDVLRQMLLAGVDVFRLNFSHGTHDSHTSAYRAIREAAASVGRVVAILQDLAGPKIRTGAFENGEALTLRPGATLRIAAGDEAGSGDRVYTPYAPLIESAKAGDRLLLDDGRIELMVTGRERGELVTTVVNGGSLGQRKGINAPGVALPASAVTPKDEEDLRFGLQLGVDYVALSFVQTPEDVEHALRVMRDAGRVVPIIAMVERPSAVERLDSILEIADGTMVARGDLGLEMPLEQVPRVQKHVIRKTRAAGLPVILATQVLESMRVEPRPTRAEVSDAANAVDEGADAIMLAGETAAGAFPVRAVETLDAIIRDAERLPPTERIAPAADLTRSPHGRALCEAAVTLATTARARAIVAVTREGHTARLLSSLRPDTQVFAAAPSEEVAARAALLWGISPVVAPLFQATSPDGVVSEIDRLERLLVERECVPRTAIAVHVNVSPELTRTDANFVIVRKVD